MRRWFFVLFFLLVLTTLNVEGKKARKVKNRAKGGKHGRGKGKMNKMKMKQDACTLAGHPCMLGQECIVTKFTKEERCVCIEHCPYVPNAQVCGSDMKTYETACHLYQMSCETRRMISAVAFGACDKYHTKHLKVEPQMARACENSQAIFKCHVDKMVERIHGWKKDGHLIRNSKKISVQDNTLTIQYISGFDEGNYTCVTYSKNGTMRTANATLKMSKMPYVAIPENHIACESGDQVMIPCIHTKDSKVKWMKNGFEVNENDMYMDKNGMLVMKQTDVDQSGTYECVAENFCGAAQAACTLNVTRKDPNKCEEGVELHECSDLCTNRTCQGKKELKCQVSRCGECDYFWVDSDMKNVTCPEVRAPKIINTQLVSLTPEGDDAVISCTATGYPEPRITWTLDDGTSIVGKRKHSFRGNNTLVVRQVVLGQDNGRYKCKAENSEGVAETTLVIAILPRMTPMCPNKDDKIMKCEFDFCATASCPAYENNENVTCINTVCNVCTYIFVDKRQNYVDCYSDPKAKMMMNKMQGMKMMGAMPGWPAGSSMGNGHGSMGSMAGWPAGSSMGAMPGWPAGSSMGAMPGWPAGSSMGGGHGSMGAMPGWPAGSSMNAMPGWPAGSSMSAMPGWPAGSSMGAMPGWPAGSSMSGGHGSMGAMPGWPAGSSMSAMPGWPAGSSMGAMPGWPAGSSMGGGHGSMGAMPGWPAGSSMSAMPGWPAGSSMGNMPGWPAGSSMGSGHGSMGSMAGWPAGSSMGTMPGWPASSSMGAMPGWPAGSSMGGGHGSMGSMPGWPAGSSMPSKKGGKTSKGGNMAMPAMDKHAWHFIAGWPGHMSQMGKAVGKPAANGGSAQQGGGADAGHLNVFYSGKPDEDDTDDSIKT